jgi:sporulation protein YabP
MENVIINNKQFEKTEQLNNRITIDNRNHISITGISKMLSSNETSINMLIKTTKLLITGKDIHIEKLDVDNGYLEASGTIDAVKYCGNDGIIKRIFK